MIAVGVIAGLFLAFALLGGLLFWWLTGYEDERCDGCGRMASRRETARWIRRAGYQYCSGDCFGGRYVA